MRRPELVESPDGEALTWLAPSSGQLELLDELASRFQYAPGDGTPRMSAFEAYRLAIDACWYKVLDRELEP